MADYFCHYCGNRTSMMGHRECQDRGRYRFRVTGRGWYRHFGGPMPELIADTPIDIITRSGNASFICGYPAKAYRGWEHSGFSGDIVFWRPTPPSAAILGG